MYVARLDLNQGAISVDSVFIEVDENGALTASIAKLCSAPNQINHRKTRYHLLNKVSVCGKSADGVIEVEEGEGYSVTFLFDVIEFFESSALESKIIKTCEKTWNSKCISCHPSTAYLNFLEWGDATFFYDAKQGDLSLELKFKRPKIYVIKNHDFKNTT